MTSEIKELLFSKKVLNWPDSSPVLLVCSPGTVWPYGWGGGRGVLLASSAWTRDATKHPTRHRTGRPLPRIKNCLDVNNVNNFEVEDD